MRWLFVLMMVLSASVVQAQGVSLSAANEQQKKAASEAYKRGQQAFETGRYEEAVTQFRASYDAVASPNSHFMMVRALERMGKNAEAYEEAKKVVAESEAEAQRDPKYAMTAQAARTKAAELKKTIGIVKLQVAGGEGGTLTVNGKEVPQSQWGDEIAVAPGAVEVALSTSDGRNVSQGNVAAGQEQTIDIAAPPPKPVAPPPSAEPEPSDSSGDGSTLRTVSIVAFAIGGAGMIVFAVFGALTLREEDRLEELCPANSCPPSLSGEADKARNYQTAANVGLVVGSVGLAAGLGLLIGSFIQDSEGDARATRPRLAVGPGAISVSGAF